MLRFPLQCTSLGPEERTLPKVDRREEMNRSLPASLLWTDYVSLNRAVSIDGCEEKQIEGCASKDPSTLIAGCASPLIARETDAPTNAKKVLSSVEGALALVDTIRSAYTSALEVEGARKEGIDFHQHDFYPSS